MGRLGVRTGRSRWLAGDRLLRHSRAIVVPIWRRSGAHGPSRRLLRSHLHVVVRDGKTCFVVRKQINGEISLPISIKRRFFAALPRRGREVAPCVPRCVVEHPNTSTSMRSCSCRLTRRSAKEFTLKERRKGSSVTQAPSVLDRHAELRTEIMRTVNAPHSPRA
jgi:hypothetical protein